MKRKILVLAYQVSPYRGSEYSVGWNFVTNMNKVADLVILYGASGLHMGDTEELDKYVSSFPVPGVRFIPVKPGVFAKFFNSANKRGFLTYSFYFAYRFWHFQAYQAAKNLLAQEPFDLIHYVGPIGYREPGFLWKIDLPYVWGPIGGAGNVPRQMLPALPVLSRAKLIFRASINWFQLRTSRRVYRALARADMLLTATSRDQEIFKRVLGFDSKHVPENTVSGDIRLNSSKFESFDRIHITWIGSGDPRKAPRLLVDALSACAARNKFTVHVVGDVPLQFLRTKLDEAGLTENFIFYGHTTRGQVHELFEKSHLHVVTSVSEGNPTTIWEAMRHGVPTLTVDHCGMHDSVLDNIGIRVPLANYPELVLDFARRLENVSAHPQVLVEMAERVVDRAKEIHWDHRPAVFAQIYEKAIDNWCIRKNASFVKKLSLFNSP